MRQRMGHSLFALWSLCGGVHLSLVEMFFSLQIKGSPGEHDTISFLCQMLFIGDQLARGKEKQKGRDYAAETPAGR